MNLTWSFTIVFFILYIGIVTFAHVEFRKSGRILFPLQRIILLLGTGGVTWLWVAVLQKMLDNTPHY